MKAFSDKKLKLAQYTLKHYEPALDTYFFYNARKGSLWKTDKITGFVVAALDGVLSCKDIVNVLHENNKDLSIYELQKHFYKIFEFLLEEDYVCEHI